MANELMKLDIARQAIIEAKSIDEVKDIRDKAEAMRQYARQAKLSLEMQNDIAEIKIRAERRAGEILIEMKENDERSSKGGDGSNQYQLKSHDGTLAKPPTLSDLGLTRNDSSRWQTIARIPEEKFEQKIAETKAAKHELTSVGLLTVAKQLKKVEKAEAKSAIPRDLPRISERYQLHVGDLSDVMPTLKVGSVDIVITDPPYPREYLHLYERLAITAKQILPVGGSLLVMIGQSYLPEVLSIICPSLHYQWTLSYLTPGGQSAQLWNRKVNTFWKPVLWFTNGNYNGDWIGDVVKSAVNDNDKRFHHWGQSESGMAELIEKFTYPGQTILDPFCGGGTTGVVALKMNRRFIGIDISQQAIDTTLQRFQEIEDAG